MRFSPEAWSDLEDIHAYLDRESPGAASRVAIALVAACDRLELFPERGRPGLEPGTRELATVWPYLITYRIEPDRDVTVLRIRHGARRR